MHSVVDGVGWLGCGTLTVSEACVRRSPPPCPLAARSRYDRGSAALQPSGDLPHAHPLTVQGGDSLPLQQGQVSIRAHRLSQPNRDDPTDLGAPSVPGRSGDPDLPARLASAHPGLEQLPIPGLNFQLSVSSSTSTATPSPKSSSVATSTRTQAAPEGHYSLGSDTFAPQLSDRLPVLGDGVQVGVLLTARQRELILPGAEKGARSGDRTPFALCRVRRRRDRSACRARWARPSRCPPYTTRMSCRCRCCRWSHRGGSRCGPRCTAPGNRQGCRQGRRRRR